MKTLLTVTDNELYNKNGKAKVLLELENGGKLSAVCQDNSLLEGEYNKRILGWDIPPLKTRALEELFDKIVDDCQIIIDNASIEWNGSNYVGRLNETASLAVDAIEARIHDYKSYWNEDDIFEVVDAYDYFDEVIDLDDMGITKDNPPEKIAEELIAIAIESGIFLDAASVQEFVEEILE